MEANDKMGRSWLATFCSALPKLGNEQRHKQRWGGGARGNRTAPDEESCEEGDKDAELRFH